MGTEPNHNTDSTPDNERHYTISITFTQPFLVVLKCDTRQLRSRGRSWGTYELLLLHRCYRHSFSLKMHNSVNCITFHFSRLGIETPMFSQVIQLRLGFTKSIHICIRAEYQQVVEICTHYRAKMVGPLKKCNQSQQKRRKNKRTAVTYRRPNVPTLKPSRYTSWKSVGQEN